MRSGFESMRDSLFSDFSDFIDDATIREGAEEIYDPATGTTSTVYAVSIATKCFRKDYNSEQVQGEILAGDTEIIIKSGGISEVRPNSRVTVGSDSYNVIMSKPVPKKEPIIQRLHCRGFGDA
ncbi:hypothetical protein [Methanoculleus sp.]|uniref:hypothetical protein n=1 Tax=Methanoculleus sp. TaxID=90427 RepID=UPI0025F0DC5B|nr:hypothetical protein [Methanoculleus sp.]MCK9319926.1 hypothetical protein [Methanoculleus sp.]